MASPVGRISRRRNPTPRLVGLRFVRPTYMIVRDYYHRPDPPCRIGKVLDFFGFEGTVEDGAFAVGEPFLEDLVAAEFVGPNCSGQYRVSTILKASDQ